MDEDRFRPVAAAASRPGTHGNDDRVVRLDVGQQPSSRRGEQTDDAGQFDEANEALGSPAGETSVQFETFSVSAFEDREPPPRAWLVRDMVPARNVTLLSGDGGTGKSLLALQLAVAVAAGRSWVGTMPEPGRVLYLSAEDDIDEVHRRLGDIAAANDVAFADLADLHIAPLAGKDAVLALPASRTDVITETPLFRALVGKLETLRPNFFVVDNLADAFAGNENSRSQTRQFVGMLRGLAISLDLSILLLGHPSLTGLSSGTGLSGSTAWSNSVRSRLYLERAKADDGVERDPNLRILKVMKANYASIGTEVRLRWERGVLRLEGSGPGMFDRLAAEAKAEAKFLDLLEMHTDQGRTVSPNPCQSYAPAVFAQHPDAAGFRKRAFSGAMERLLSAGKIAVKAFGPPSKQRHKIVRVNGEQP